MYRKQRGITLMGFIMVAAIAGFFALIGFKLFPAYSEYSGVIGAMKSVGGQPGADKMELTELQRALQKRFDVGYVDTVSAKQATLIKDKGPIQLNINYEYRAPLFYNLDYVAKFDYTVTLNNQAAVP
jgi:Tfp pilus assembly major pilin PilA